MRLFIAIPISKKLKKELEEFQEQQVVRSVKWTNPKNFHITVQFLGEIESQHLEEIKKRLDGTARLINSFKLEIEDIKYTGPDVMKNPPGRKMVWVILGGDGEYQKLATTVAAKLREFSNEAPWGEDAVHKEKIPHITLGRLTPYSSRQHVSDLKKTTIKEKNVFVDSFELWESELTPEGPVYRSIGKFKLAKK